AEHVLTPLEIIGDVIARRFGPSRVLVLGAADTATAVARGGHESVGVKDYRRATGGVGGDDFELTYQRLTAACRVAARPALVTPNVDPRFPIEAGDFLPGCGAIVAAVATAAQVQPIVVGKPDPPLFTMALDRLGLRAGDCAMVGDSVPSDIRGA